MDEPVDVPEEEDDDDVVNLDLELKPVQGKVDRCKVLRTLFGRVWGNSHSSQSVDDSIGEEGASDVINLDLDIGEIPKDDYAHWAPLLWAVNRAKGLIGRQPAVQIRRLELMAKLGKYKWGLAEDALEICEYLNCELVNM